MPLPTTDPLVRLELPYPPTTGNHATKRRGKRYYTDARLVAWQKNIGVHVILTRADGRAAAKPIEGDIIFAMQWHPPDKRRRDEDNLAKVVKDALTRAGVWLDDAQVVESHTFKLAPFKGGKVIVEVWRKGETDEAAG